MIEDSKKLYLQKPVEIKYVIINVVIFLLIKISMFLSFAAGYEKFDLAGDWLSVPSNLTDIGLKIWTLGSYMFTHSLLLHLVYNMIFLYFSGRIFSDLLGTKKFVKTYWIGGLMGALFFIVGYAIMGKLGNVDLPLMGASASVFAIFIGIAAYVPNYTITLPFLGPAKLKYIAIVFVILSLPLTASNSGGHLAHFGGFMWGLIWATYLKRGADIGSWFDQTYDWVMSLFSGKTQRPEPSRKRRARTKIKRDPEGPSQKEIDIILDKVGKSGYESLSKEEKDILFKASK